MFERNIQCISIGTELDRAWYGREVECEAGVAERLSRPLECEDEDAIERITVEWLRRMLCGRLSSMM
jgi:hypothetical protein